MHETHKLVNRMTNPTYNARRVARIREGETLWGAVSIAKGVQRDPLQSTISSAERNVKKLVHAPKP